MNNIAQNKPQNTPDKEYKELADYNACVLALQDNFEWLYDINLETGEYKQYVKSKTFSEAANTKLVENGNFFEDAQKNVEIVVHPEDRWSFKRVVNKENIVKSLAEAPHIDWHYRLVVDGNTSWFKMRIVYKDSDKHNIIIGIFNANDEVAEKKRAEQERKELIAKAVGTESTYVVDPKTDKFTVISRNEYLEENYPSDQTYSWSISQYIQKDVFDTDKKEAANALKLKNIVNSLEQKGEYVYRFRDISSGMPRWYEMRAAMLSDKEILLGFSNKDNDVIGLMLFEKMRDSYFGLYYINLDSGLAQIVKTGHPDITGEVGAAVPYSTLMNNIITTAEQNSVPLLDKISDVKYLKAHFAKEEHSYGIYKSRIIKGNQWVTLTGLVLSRHEDGTPSVVALGFSFLDDEAAQKEDAQDKLKESMEVVGGLASEYTAIYHVDLDTDDYVPYHIISKIEDIKALYDKCPKFADLAHGFADSELVRPEDRLPLRAFYPSAAAVKEQLKDKKRISMLFKRNYEGEFLWTEIAIVKCEAENEEAHKAVIGFVEKDKEVKDRAKHFLEVEETNRLVENIASNYNLAYRVNIKDDSFKVLRGDKNMLGQDREYSSFSDVKTFFFANVVHPADKDRMAKELDYDEIRRKLDTRKSYQIEYRALIDGASIWNELNVTQISKDEVTLGFALKDLEIIKRRLEDKRIEGYVALFVIDIDTGMIKTLKNSSTFKTPAVGQAEQYEASMKSFANNFDGDTKAFFDKLSSLDYLKRDLAIEDWRYFSYKSPLENSTRWLDGTLYTILRHEDGTPSVVTLGFSYADSGNIERMELQKQIKEANLRNNALFEISRSNRWSYEISTEDEVISYSYTDSAVQKFDVTQNPMAWLDLIHPDDRKNTEAIFWAAIHDHSGNTPYDPTFRILGKNGKYSWVKSSGRLIRHDDGTAELYGMSMDITKQIAQQEQQKKLLEDALSAAESANYAKTAFLSSMSHDIRTPMNAIIGYTTMAQKYIDDRTRALDYLGKIGAAGGSLLELINQVLDMSKIESGKVVLYEDPADIITRVYEIAEILDNSAQAKNITLSTQIDHIRDRKVIADCGRMNQLLLNILGNAVKYTPEGGTINFSLSQIDCAKKGYATYVFTTEDNGIGMSKEYIDKIFEPFSRENTSTVSKIQGTGLGMAIVKKLVDLMGGKINIESKQGEGTKIMVTLTFKLQKATQISATKEEKDVNIGLLKGHRTLLVEDNEMNREIATMILEEHGLDVESADDGDTAVKKMQSLVDLGEPKYYDFILMDVQMPRMNGYEATKQIREIMKPFGIHIPIIALSANAFEEDRQRSIAAGMDDHIAKPIDIDQLLETMAKYI